MHRIVSQHIKTKHISVITFKSKLKLTRRPFRNSKRSLSMVKSKYTLRDKRGEKKANANFSTDRDLLTPESTSSVPDKALSYLNLSDPQRQDSEAQSKKMTRSKKTKSTSFRKNKTAPSAVSSIYHPEINDVLCGRGGNINNHTGNKAFRSFVQAKKYDYNLTKNKSEKARISQSIVDIVHNLQPKGRFMKAENGVWREVDDATAMKKTSQALREGAPILKAQAQAVKGVARKTAKSLSTLGKRKRESSRNKSARNSKSTLMKKTEAEAEAEPLHPLIVPMANGHRGKELRFRQTTQDETKESQKTSKSPPEEIPSTLLQRPVMGTTRMNSLVSGDFNSSFNGDENFVNPFLNENEGLCGKGRSIDITAATTNTTSSTVVGDDAMFLQVLVPSAESNHNKSDLESACKDAGSE